MIIESALAKIRGKRCELKLTQQDMANKLGITLKTYCFKEKGTSDFTLKEVVELCKIFNCTLNDIFLIQ